MSVATVPHELPGDVSPSVELLMSEAGSYLPPQAVQLLERAYEVAETAHAGQFRKSGEPYVVHAVATAYYLAKLHLDVTCIVAGLLHDTIEDTELTFDDLEREFGHAVARIVEGVSKFGEIGHRHRLWATDRTESEIKRDRSDLAKQQAENVRKMFLAMAEDPRVVIVKLADRLHNMRTLEYQPPHKQRRIALDTREIYAPLAGRLGIAQIKTPLEDFAFKYLEPDAYRWLVAQLAEERASRQSYIEQMGDSLRATLAQHGIEAEVTGRAKHLWSIYKKLRRPEINMDLTRIYDLFALRVVVDEVAECYQALGLVHALWQPIPGRFKDYIATPKNNGYRSLHTTVFADTGRATEIQIRTHAMHEVAEFGVATHWYYKEKGKSASLPQPLADWISALTEWQNELNPDAAEFVDTLKTDMFSGQVFVFTPRGDIVDLPVGSTPIDFAYRIHTELGHRTIGAKVNGQMVPLDTPLQTNDRVEVLATKTAHGPGRDWLQFAATQNARQKIRQWFKRQKREDNIARGRELLDAELRKLAQATLNEIRPEVLQDAATHFALRGPDDMYALLGHGDLSVHQVVNRLGLLPHREEELPLEAPPAPAPPGEVRVLGVGDLLTRLATDCQPAPGDEIVGYITRNRGVTVHRTDCPRIRAEKERERLVHVDWGLRDERQLYTVSIMIDAWDRAGLLRDITIAVADERVNMTSAAATTSADGRASITATLRIGGIDELSRVFARIERVRGVLEVRRLGRARAGSAPA
ncbi:MAG TPA: bifunctional (p)ppGpp synthetase/guanosine-3',5'-bis(diphosphate) 3'-pyrophosphohydrolase [Chloroflexota bacterium]|nr:bifunctional (p)ppGpp synthetase/guanosine-3',5'-bis(diphosphate) 3'-pyrophosphohydrolase [Chloroflexota bacterium]